jgi:hypothetical protein
MRWRRRRSRPRSLLVMLGLGLALGLGAAACGGSPDGNGVATLGGDGGNRQQTGSGGGAANGAASKDPQEAALEFAKCMREHGVDMPDPEVDSQGRMRITVRAGRDQADPKKLNEAQQACGHLMGGGGDGPGRLDPKAEDAMLAFARCMREHGIDMPDPTGNGLIFNSKRGQGPDPTSSKFKEAERACDHHLADLGRVERSRGARP